jgi:hypothetical protein
MVSRMRTKRNPALASGWRPLVTGPRFTGMLLMKQFLATAGNFASSFSIVSSLPSVSSLPHHGLVYNSRVEWHAEQLIADFNVSDYFSAGIINWDLHFLAPFD